MVSLIIGYSAYVLHNDRKINKHLKKDSSISKARELWIILFSLVGVLISGKFAVGSAVEVARTIGMSEWVIGATILAIIRDDKVISDVGPEDELRVGDTVVVIGKKKSLEKFEELDSL